LRRRVRQATNRRSVHKSRPAAVRHDEAGGVYFLRRALQRVGREGSRSARMFWR